MVHRVSSLPKRVRQAIGGVRRFSLEVDFRFGEIRTAVVLPEIPHFFTFEYVLEREMNDRGFLRASGWKT